MYMRTALFSLAAALVCFGSPAQCEEPAQQPPKVTIESLDGQISLIKEEIAKYNNLANMFDRKSSELQSQDFSGSRHAASLRDELRARVKDLEGKLQELETTRSDMLPKTTAPAQ
jgi:hypothetical protein